MTRECEKDFEAIKGYVESYSISHNLKKANYISSLKMVHRGYFSAITWSSELSHGRDEFLKTYKNANDDIVLRLSEVVSDLGSCVFNWLNGNYKVSKIMLRVCIENFIRAVSAIEDKSQISEKNVYKLFVVASSQSVFDECKEFYSMLHADYVNLCADAHTAALQNMEHLTSLADIPAFDDDKSCLVKDFIVRVSENVNLIFCLVFNDFYHSMHHRNKENILNGLKKRNKPLVMRK
jgi:hypothetical protein